MTMGCAVLPIPLVFLDLTSIRLPAPERAAPYYDTLFQLLWNDPAPDEQQTEKFAPNSRGPGIYTFNHESVRVSAAVVAGCPEWWGEGMR